MATILNMNGIRGKHLKQVEPGPVNSHKTTSIRSSQTNPKSATFLD